MHIPIIALTSDDINPTTRTPKLKELLSTINRFDINATLFVIPKSSSQWNPHSSVATVLKDAMGGGHEIGLHGFRHYPFETWSSLGLLGPSCSEIREKIAIGMRILNERLETDLRGFRAPYYQISKNLLRALDDLNFIYDSSKIALTKALLSYVPLMRVAWFSRRRGLPASKMFHPINLKLWEIPITQEFTWYNLKLEASRFHTFLQNNTRQIEPGYIVINSHIETLSEGGLRILRELFLFVKERGLVNLTLQQIAERHTSLKTTRASV